MEKKKDGDDDDFISISLLHRVITTIRTINPPCNRDFPSPTTQRRRAA